MTKRKVILAVTAVLGAAGPARGQVCVRGETVFTMAGAPIADGVVVIREGKITAVGPAAEVTCPDGYRVLSAKIVTPGLIDAHSTAGLTGIYNIPHDQDQLERSAPLQPELRAIDAYNPQEELIEYVRSYGITTLHTGHAPGELMSGQTAIVKTTGRTVAEAVLVESAALAATLSPMALKRERGRGGGGGGEGEGGKSPGTRGKAMAMLRAELIRAQEYERKREKAPADKRPDRDLRAEVLGRVLRGELPLLITANNAQDIASVLRLKEEFGLRVWLDGAAESYLLVDELKSAAVPVVIHPSMTRAFGEMKNLSFETAAKLLHAGIPVAMQSGYESYVPKTRVVLFEAAIGAANGLTFEEALGTITIGAARMLGIDGRVGSIEVGKDGDVALYDGDPFEYATHCVGVVINGEVVSEVTR